MDKECQPLELACLGRPFRLGCLYNRGTDRLTPGTTLWNREELRGSLKVSTVEYSEASVVIVEDSISSKATVLGVDVGLKLSCLSGLVDFSGWPV